MEPKVIFEDSEILVLDKPAGMVVNRSDTTKGEKTVQDWVESKFRIQNSHFVARRAEFRIGEETDFYKRAGIVHRLDKETSGILLVAKTSDAFVNLQAQFKQRKVQKTYVALVHGKIEPESGEIDVAVGRLPWNRKRFGVLSGGREAVTKYKILRYYDTKILGSNGGTLVELYPKSGRTHQIRVHLQYIHHSIFADPLYGGRKTSRTDRKLLPRVFLHAAKVSFMHLTFAEASAGGPKTNKPLSFECPLPADLKRFLATLNS